MAQTIADAIKAPTFDIASAEPSAVADFDMIILGTPVEGFKAAKETLAFAERLPNAEDKKSILFCTYKLYKGKTFKALAEILNNKGYTTVLEVSKKNVKPGQTDFSDALGEIKKKL